MFRGAICITIFLATGTGFFRIGPDLPRGAAVRGDQGSPGQLNPVR
jgi:hypothetical protein